MSFKQLQHQETLLLEQLLSSLDTRETARATGSTMLTYLANLVVQQTHKELEEVRKAIVAQGTGTVGTPIADA